MHIRVNGHAGVRATCLAACAATSAAVDDGEVHVHLLHDTLIACAGPHFSIRTRGAAGSAG
eukprot:scaffold161442_cov19-Tisochrysis_lutea.AAC.1